MQCTAHVKGRRSQGGAPSFVKHDHPRRLRAAGRLLAVTCQGLGMGVPHILDAQNLLTILPAMRCWPHVTCVCVCVCVSVLCGDPLRRGVGSHCRCIPQTWLHPLLTPIQARRWSRTHRRKGPRCVGEYPGLPPPTPPPRFGAELQPHVPATSPTTSPVADLGHAPRIL